MRESSSADNFRNRGLIAMKDILKAFLKDDRGQSTTEYILILAVVVMVAMRFKSIFQQQLYSAMQQLGGNINQAMTDTSGG